MGIGFPGSRAGALVAALLIAAALCAALATDVGAAKLVGKNGRVYACYKAKGKSKGAVRLVTKKSHCRHGEKKISWNVAGPAGEAGQSGENGSNGEAGQGGETGTAGMKTLEQRVTQLTNKLTSLESVLKGITNTELLGALSKLQGISGTQLQEAVAKVPVVNTLCTQTAKLTEQSNAMGSAVEGITLLGSMLLELVIPELPVALPKFSC